MKACIDCGRVKFDFQFYKIRTTYYSVTVSEETRLCKSCASKVASEKVNEYVRLKEKQNSRVI